MSVGVSELCNGLQMVSRCISLVSVEPVPWISAMECRHLPVTDHFCHD